MTTYSKAWRACCRAVTVLGFGIALLVWSIAGVLAGFVLAAVLTGLWRHLLGHQASGRDSSTMTVACGRAAAGGVTAISIGGLAYLSTSMTLLLAGLAVVSSPRVVRNWRSRRSREALADRESAPGHGDDLDLETVAREVDEACLRSLSNAELCLAWRRSYTALLQPSSVMHRALVVACRQAYLDEMEQRDPVGLSAWLCAGARAASGPERYLHGGGG